MEAYEEPQLEAEEEEPPCFATPIEKLQVQLQPVMASLPLLHANV